MTGLERLLAPRSIALLGASSDPAKFGGRPLAGLRRWGFAGELHVVNPQRDEVQGVPCSPSVQALPTGLDLAVVMLPADAALDAVAACVAHGFGAVLLMSGGFGESGHEGQARQDRLRSLLDGSGIRLLGPNTPGFANVRGGVTCSASAFIQRDAMFPGRVAFVAQSGALAGILADRAFDQGIGVNAVVCTGNELDVGTAELLDHFAADPETHAVGLFLEGLGRDRRLADAIERARCAGLGITVLKAGRSEPGRRVVASHTANVVGDDGAFAALCDTLGVIRARDYAELLEATQLLATAPRPGRRVAVVGSSGGMNTLLADAATDRGITLPELAPATIARIAELTPAFGSAANPVDISSVILVEPERLGRALELLAADPAIDAVVVAIGDHPPALAERFAAILAEAAPRAVAPIVIQWSAGSLSQPGIHAAGRHGLPVLGEPERCMWAIDAAARARPPRPRRAPVAAPPLDGATQLSEHETKKLLERAGIPVPRRHALTDLTEAPARVADLGGRAVVKADCVGSVHKTDVGAVRVGVAPSEAAHVGASVLAAARASFGEDAVRGVIVEELVEPVAEFVVAVSADEQVGPLVTVGAGGRLVELADDAVSRLAPVNEDEAHAMLAALRSAALLDGFRGGAAGDRDALAALVARLSELGAAWADRVALLEVNPVAVLPRGAVALDAVLEVRA